MFTERLPYYLGEINAIHPFRECNGRAQRAFIEQLTSDAGFILDWQHLNTACIGGGLMSGRRIREPEVLDSHHEDDIIPIVLKKPNHHWALAVALHVGHRFMDVE